MCIRDRLDAGVTGIEKIVRDSGGSCSKFSNLTQEVMVALCFQGLGAKAALLGDCAFGDPPTYTPDIEVTTSDGRVVLVEVTCRSSGAAAMDVLVHEMVKEHQLPFRVSYGLGPALSTSPTDFSARRIQEEVAQRACQRIRTA